MKTISEHNNEVDRIKKMRNSIRVACKLCQDGLQPLDVLCDDCLIQAHRTKKYNYPVINESIDAHCPKCFRKYTVEMP